MICWSNNLSVDLTFEKLPSLLTWFLICWSNLWFVGLTFIFNLRFFLICWHSSAQACFVISQHQFTYNQIPSFIFNYSFYVLWKLAVRFKIRKIGSYVHKTKPSFRNCPTPKQLCPMIGVRNCYMQRSTRNNQIS